MSKEKGERDTFRTFGEVTNDIEEAYLKLPEYKEEKRAQQLRKRFVSYSVALSPFTDRNWGRLEEADEKQLRIISAKLVCCIAWLLRKHGLKLSSLFECFYKEEQKPDEEPEGTGKRHTSPDNSQGKG